MVTQIGTRHKTIWLSHEGVSGSGRTLTFDNIGSPHVHTCVKINQLRPGLWIGESVKLRHERVPTPYRLSMA